jgi:transcriptional regulator with XRE-family HTH domain
MRLPHLAAWRKRADLSQEELASAVGVTQGMISQWENGRADITLETIERSIKENLPVILMRYPGGV